MIPWNNIEELIPDELTPVFLSTEKTESLSGTQLGHLKQENGERVWLLGNDRQALDIGLRPYWIYLKVDDVRASESAPSEELILLLEKCIEDLTLYEGKFIQLAKHMVSSGKGIYPLDLFISGSLKRCLSLITGFKALLAASNFTAAAHLVRPYLDTYLRLLGAWLVNDPHDFATRVMKGEPINKIKDRNNQPLKDIYLKEVAAAKHPWIKTVYDETSAFVHFSNKHIFDATTISSSVEGSFSTVITRVDNNVSIHSKLEASSCMIAISNLSSEMIYGWIDTKRQLG